MKRFLFMAVAAIGLLLTSCETLIDGLDDGGDISDPTTSSGTVRYEAEMGDTENFDLWILYTTAEGAIKEHKIVKSPFVLEFKAKYGNYIYLSATALPKGFFEDGYVTNDEIEYPYVSVKIFENNKLMVSDKREYNAIIMGLFGVEDSYYDCTDED